MQPFRNIQPFAYDLHWFWFGLLQGTIERDDPETAADLAAHYIPWSDLDCEHFYGAREALGLDVITPQVAEARAWLGVLLS